MYRFRNVILSLMPLMVAAQSNDSLRASHLQRFANYSSAVSHPDLKLFNNPALQPIHYDNSLSEIEFCFEDQKSDSPKWIELGNGYRGGAFKASSFTHLGSSSVIWGEAGYDNGKRLNQLWSENADYMIIRPYVTADTIGGDMLCEQYTFRGGYARQGDRWMYGAQMGYRSGLEYRDHDPRPKCTTLDVDITLGVSYKLSSQYMVGAYVSLSKYNQQQSIRFMNPRGVSMVYQMTGLGTHYFRFKGDKTDTRYDGSSWGAGLNMCKSDGMGPSISISSSKFSLEKQLNDEHYLPICEITNWHHQLQLSWHQPLYYIIIDADINHRVGNEHIYDSGVTFYKEITSIKNYLSDTQQVTVKAGRKYMPSKSFEYELQPIVCYTHEKTCYESPYRESSYSSICGQICFDGRWQHRNGLLSMQAYGGYNHNLSQKLVINNSEDFPFAVEGVERNHQSQKASYCIWGTSLRHDWPITRFVSTIFVKVAAKCQLFAETNTNRTLSLSAGFVL